MTQKPMSEAWNQWAEVMTAASRQTRSTMELPRQLAACETADDVAKVQSAYVSDAIQDSMQAQAALLTLMFPAVSVIGLDATRDALALDARRSDGATEPGVMHIVETDAVPEKRAPKPVPRPAPSPHVSEEERSAA
ncbi:MAG: hypothetical protein AAF125_21995 [Chloroflexota bacterium]